MKNHKEKVVLKNLLEQIRRAGEVLGVDATEETAAAMYNLSTQIRKEMKKLN